MATKDMRLNIKVNGANKAKQDVKGFEGSLASTIGTAAALTAAFMALRKAMELSVVFKNAARDAVETRQKFEQVYSSIVDEAHKMSQSLQESFQLAGATAEDLLANTGDLLVGFGFTEQKALSLSDRIVKLTLDLRSFKNIQMEASEVTQLMVSAMSGNMRAIRSLGVVLRLEDADLKNLIETYRDKEGYDQKQAVAMAVLDEAYNQSYKSIGDVARTAKELANQERFLEERIKGLRIEIGERLLPVFSAVTGAAIKASDAFSEAFTAKFAEISQQDLDALVGSFVTLAKVLGFVANQSVKSANAWNSWGKYVVALYNPITLATTGTWEFLKAVTGANEEIKNASDYYNGYAEYLEKVYGANNKVTESILVQKMALKGLTEDEDTSGIDLFNFDEIESGMQQAFNAQVAEFQKAGYAIINTNKETVDEVEKDWSQATSIMSNTLYEAFGGQFDNIEEMWKNMLKRMAADLFVSGLMSAINPASTGVGFFSAGGLFGNIFGGGSTESIGGGGSTNNYSPPIVSTIDTGGGGGRTEQLLEAVIEAIYNMPQPIIRAVDDIEFARRSEHGNLLRIQN